MDAKHKLLDQYLIPVHGDENKTYETIDEVINENNKNAGENKLSEQLTYNQVWINKGPPSSVAQILPLQKEYAFRILQDCIFFYNDIYCKFVQNQVLQPELFTIEDLDALFKQIQVKRFTREQPEDIDGIRAIRKDRQLICMNSNDKRECCDSQIGLGLSLSSWPPNTPFLHFAAIMGSAKIVSHLIKHYGCWVDAQQKEDKGTALHLAAYYGHLNVVNALLQANPNITLKNSIKQKRTSARTTETALQAANQGKQQYNELSDDSKNKFFPIFRKKTQSRGRFNSNWEGQWDEIITKLSNHNPRPEGINP